MKKVLFKSICATIMLSTSVSIFAQEAEQVENNAPAIETQKKETKRSLFNSGVKTLGAPSATPAPTPEYKKCFAGKKAPLTELKTKTLASTDHLGIVESVTVSGQTPDPELFPLPEWMGVNLPDESDRIGFFEIAGIITKTRTSEQNALIQDKNQKICTVYNTIVNNASSVGSECKKTFAKAQKVWAIKQSNIFAYGDSIGNNLDPNVLPKINQVIIDSITNPDLNQKTADFKKAILCASYLFPVFMAP